MTTPTIFNIRILNDTDYRRKFTVYADKCRSTLKDLSGYTFKAEAKVSEDDELPAFEFDIDTSDAINGGITLSILHDVNISIENGEYVWDLRVVDPNDDVDRWLKGTVTVEKTTTRA